MVIYQCPRCHYRTIYKNDVRRHINRKKGCKATHSDNSLSIKDIDLLNIDKFSNNVSELKKELKEKNKQINELISKVGNNNNNTINNNTINNNTINIHINDFKDTNYVIALEELKDSIKKSLLKNDGMNMNIECENLIELVHCNKKYPENHNILVTDKTRNEARVKDGNEFKLVSKDDIIEEATERIVNLLRENRLFGRYIRFHEKKDEDTIREDKKAVEKTLYNNRSLIMDTARENMIKI